MPRRRRPRSDEESEGNNERWLLTYSDMITLLLVLFILMYAMSTVNSQKFKTLAKEMGKAFGGETELAGVGMPSVNSSIRGEIPNPSPAPNSLLNNPTKVDAFQNVYEKIKKSVEDQGYQDKIVIEKGDSYILIKFRDNVLFFGDSYAIRPEGLIILRSICDTLVSVSNLIQVIQIDGHTAKIGNDNPNNFFSWELSSNRSISVLKFMAQDGGLPQSKMSIAGYADNVPVASNDTEEGRAMNRRVEVKITKVSK